MITLFENITEKLTDLEKQTLVPLLVNILRNTDAGMTITGAALVQFLHTRNYKTDGQRIRGMVAYIRQMNLMKPKVLIGSNKGYFVTDDVNIIDKQIESLKGRMDAMAASVSAIEAQRENLKHL